MTTAPSKKHNPYDLPNLSRLSPGQRRAVEALIGGGESARTYTEAATLAGMSEGTMLTHVNRVRQRHPRIYQRIRTVRLAQLAVRHEPWRTPKSIAGSTSGTLTAVSIGCLVIGLGEPMELGCASVVKLDTLLNTKLVERIPILLQKLGNKA